MKKVLMVSALCALLMGCNSYKSLVGYVSKNCVATNTTSGGNTIVTYECNSLYNTDKVKDKCSEISICFDGANAKLSGRAICNDSLIDIEKLIKLAVNRK